MAKAKQIDTHEIVLHNQHLQIPSQSNWHDSDSETLKKIDNSESKKVKAAASRRGRKRKKDEDYLEQGFTQLERKLQVLRQADELSIPFAERRKMRNVVQSLKVRLRSRIQTLLYDKEIKRKDDVFGFLMDSLQEMMPQDKQEDLTGRLANYMRQNDPKYQNNNLKITEKGLKFYGEIRPRKVIDCENENISSETLESPHNLVEVAQKVRTPDYFLDYFQQNEAEDELE